MVDLSVLAQKIENSLNGLMLGYQFKIHTETGELHKAVRNGNIVTEEEMRFVLGKCCYGNGHEKLIADFYHCIQTGQHFTLDGAEASKVLKIIFAVYKNSGAKENV